MRSPHFFQPGGPAELCSVCHRVAHHELHIADSSSLTQADRVDVFVAKLASQATNLAYQFGGPVYVVGSTLTSRDPGDVDLRLALERDDVDALFGKGAADGGSGIVWTTGQHARAREELKQSRRLTRRWRRVCGRRFDFQFCVSLFSDTDGEPIWGERPRRRLDFVPLEHFTAGRGNP